MQGQRIKLTVYPSFPATYLPSLFGGRPLAGPAVRFFQLLASNYECEPEIDLDQEGSSFNPKTGRFSGTRRKVPQRSAKSGQEKYVTMCIPRQ